ncbi:MAG: dockerin type I domain-containing protein [Candidatus Bathyarchaeia archaeon]
MDGGQWYPISINQYGMNLMWTLSGGYGILELSASVGGCDVYGYFTNYTKYYESYGEKSFLHIQSLSSIYNSYFWWASAEVSGAGTLGIRNGNAKNHEGHHVLIWVHAELWYRPLVVLVPYIIKIHSFNFVLGDDVPNTDCWLTVEQGRTRLSNPHPIPLGDMNGDRRVDHTDIGIVYSMLGANPPYDYRYCDMNVNGKVDYEDVGSEFSYYLGWQTRNYTYAPPIEQTTSAFGQAINELRKYTMNDGQEDEGGHCFSVGYEVTG